MAPDWMRWEPLYPGDSDRNGVELYCGDECVAVVSVMNGRWHTTVNLDRPSTKLKGSFCASRQQGMRWVNRWAKARLRPPVAPPASRGPRGVPALNAHLAAPNLQHSDADATVDHDGLACHAGQHKHLRPWLGSASGQPITDASCGFSWAAS